MSKNRYSAKTDANQKEIVRKLRQIPGVTVSVNHDDILVGHKGVTRWYEIKREDKVLKSGKISKSALKDSQKKLQNEWTGHYKIVVSAEDILTDMGIK